jgi:hypothetical protein
MSDVATAAADATSRSACRRPPVLILYILPKPQTKINNGTAAAVAATVKGD